MDDRRWMVDDGVGMIDYGWWIRLVDDECWMMDDGGWVEYVVCGLVDPGGLIVYGG